MIVRKTYKYKLKLTKAQEKTFDSWLGVCRLVYNLGLEIKSSCFKHYQVKLSKYDLMKQITGLRADFYWIQEVPQQSLEDTMKRLDKSFLALYKGGGYPKFAKKNRYKSFTFRNNISFLNNAIKLPKIGAVKIFNDRPIKGKIKTATVIKEYDGWYISLSVLEEHVSFPKANNEIGIDLGITHFAVTSEGEYFENPKNLKASSKKLRSAQKSLSRKRKGSANWYKALFSVQKVHSKVKRQREDFLHKLSTKIISENQVIVLEDLKVSNMIKNRKLSKAIFDCSWGEFRRMLTYKSEWNGRQLIIVNPANTSKNCSDCGFKVESMPLSVREWGCPKCHSKHNRDENAAINIKNKGLGLNLSSCGETVNPEQSGSILRSNKLHEQVRQA